MARNLFGLVHTLLDDSGALEPGGTVEVYDAGTTTPRTVYSDRGLTTTAGSTITADAAGRFPERWVADSVSLKLLYKDASGATLSTRDYANQNLNPVPATWETAALGAVSGNEQVHHTFQTYDANQTRVIIRSYRFSNGSTHETNALEFRRRVDNNNHGHVRFQFDRTAIGFNGTNHWEFTSAGDLLPTTTESFDIGSTSREVDNIFLQNAATVSDMRRKNDLGEIAGKQALAFVDKLEPRWFTYKDTVREDGSVARHSRPHAGFMAQQFKEAMKAAGIEDFAGYAYDDENDVHLLRLQEMIGVLTAAVKALAAGHVQAEPVDPVEPEPDLFEQPDPRDEELAALRARVAELEARDTSVFADAPLLPAPDALLSDYGPVGTDDITGDLLLDAFEENEAETAAIVQTLSAMRLKHLSEQLNVERARLDREHQATGVANPRSASIDRLLGLLTRRGEV